MKNIEEKIYNKIWNGISFEKVMLSSILDDDVRSKCFDMVQLPAMNQIIFNSTRNLILQIKNKFK
jgi:hypothetical protein